MAGTKAKRSVRPTQPPRKAARHSNRHTTNRHSHPHTPAQIREQARASSKRVMHFPQVRGKVVEDVEFSFDPEYNTLHLRFQDNSSLSLEFATGFAIEAYFSRWKDGNERVLRYWPRVHCEPAF